MVLLQFAIVVLRYVFGISYIFLDESVLYMHATLFMLGAGYTLLADAHVRADIFYGRFATRGRAAIDLAGAFRSEEHTSELQSLMRTSYAVFCLKKHNDQNQR